ncbi:hypothetical protein HAX54_005698 [Datura stramonium]|uniref:Uncharacterized protein n=1 Tax=Datura stramonium TaxID=4076 RepID=A0ABS8TAF3_DATST|nr:hypothetical protein [Datura stramonium]
MDLVEMVVYQTWSHLFTPYIPELHEKEVGEFYHVMMFTAEGKELIKKVNGVNIILHEQLLGQIREDAEITHLKAALPEALAPPIEEPDPMNALWKQLDGGKKDLNEKGEQMKGIGEVGLSDRGSKSVVEKRIARQGEQMKGTGEVGLCDGGRK